ncbi:hypothetical protein HFD88_005333 [Aspergillus terreus]|nr:hypothetical protein HFD88_005333 [Aspergillus terreus]
MNSIYPTDEDHIAQCIRHRANSMCGYHIMPHTARISQECQRLCDGLPEHALDDSTSDEGSPPREVDERKK